MGAHAVNPKIKETMQTGNSDKTYAFGGTGFQPVLAISATPPPV